MKPERILVRGPNWIGDGILALPFYERLRESYPRSHLTLVGPEPTLLHASRKFFDVQIPLPIFQPAVSDLGISLPASFRAGLWLFRSGARQRVGFAEAAARVFYDDSLPWNGRASGVHKSRLYLNFLTWMTGEEQSLPEYRNAPRSVEKLFVVAPGASISLREWPYFPELVRALRERYPQYRVVLVGAEKEKKWSPVFRRANVSNVEDLFGKTTLEETQALCEKAAVVIANDSGIAHLAATVAGAPTVVLFGPGDPAYIQPRGTKVIGAWREGLPCRPCESATCRAPFGYQACLRQLGVDQVLSCLERAL